MLCSCASMGGTQMSPGDGWRDCCAPSRNYPHFRAAMSLFRKKTASGREVRQMLYRQGRTTYLVLFCLVDADHDGKEDTVRVLHVRHGAQRPIGTSED